jgi:ABC-type transport system involved in multi-copper enzyme maturation permease subunit
MNPLDTLKQVWTIASHSVLQAVRMKVVVVLIAFLLVLVPALPFLIKTDQTHLGQVRMVITYSLYLISFLLSVLTLFLSAITLNTEIKNQHIFLLDPKPVRRGALLAGKWLGVMLINLVLLAAMLATSYGCVRFLSRQWKAEGEMDYTVFRTQALTARTALNPRMPDLEEKIDEEYQRLQKENQLPEHKSEEWVRERLRAQAKQSAWVIYPNASVTWIVKGLPLALSRSQQQWVTVKFKHFGGGGASTHEIPGQFVFNASGDRRADLQKTFLVGRPHEFAVPSWTIRPDETDPRSGVLEIVYTNMDRQGVAALFPYEEGIQVLYPSATLAENYIREGLVVMANLALIAIVGIFASTFLSFPVAVLFSLLVFMVGHMANFIVLDMLEDLYVFGTSMAPPGTPLVWGDEALRGILRGFFSLFPNFAKHDAVPQISSGVLITFGDILSAYFWFCVVRGGVLALLGLVIFNRRELAALTANT